MKRIVLIDGNNEEKEKISKYVKKFERYVVCNNIKEEIINKIEQLKQQKLEYKPLDKLTSKEIAKKFIKL